MSRHGEGHSLQVSVTHTNERCRPFLRRRLLGPPSLTVRRLEQQPSRLPELRRVPQQACTETSA